MAIIFDMQKMQTKLIIAIIILFIFTILYLWVPKSDFGIRGDTKEITHIDMLYYSIMCQVGTDNHIIYPISTLAKVLSMCQFILGYAIILI